MDGKIDYSKYSDAQLREAESGINRSLFPLNFKRLEDELLRRAGHSTPVSSPAPTENLLKPIPRPARIAVQLLWVSLAVGLLSGVINWDYMTTLASPRYLLGTNIVGLLIIAWLFYKISRGRNWARITYLIMALVTWPIALLQLPEIVQHSVAAAIFLLLVFLMRIAALALLFTKESHNWFKRPNVT